MFKPLSFFVLEDEIYGYRNGILGALNHHSLTVATNVAAGKGLFVASQPFDFLLLDHDMEGFYESTAHPNTGSEFARWLTVGKFNPVPVLLHTQNEAGRTNMHRILNKAGWGHIEPYYFGREYVEMLKTRFGRRGE